MVSHPFLFVIGCSVSGFLAGILGGGGGINIPSALLIISLTVFFSSIDANLAKKLKPEILRIFQYYYL